METAIRTMEKDVVLVPPTAEQLNLWHGQLCQLGDDALDLSLRIGKRLSEIKAELKHGEWGQWVEQNLDFGIRTASNYMRVYKNQGYLLAEGVGSLDEAYRKLCPSAPRNKERSWHLSDEEMDQIEVRAEEFALWLKQGFGEHYSEALSLTLEELREYRKL
jgi:Protein of unknown function (DUF3102)